MALVNPPPRLLMGPGPVNADPRVLGVMATPLIGQHDPWMTAAMTQTQQLYRRLFGTGNDATVLIDGTSRAGTEAALVSLLSPGDRVLVPIFGRFGHLLAEIARRAGADVHVLETEFGQVFRPSRIEEAVTAIKPNVLAIVHGDTATTMMQPLDEVGAICQRHGVLLYVDATATLGGNELEVDDWGIDAASAGLQKCLSGPPGSAPLTLSARATDLIGRRRSIEAGIREPSDSVLDDPIRSNYFDLGMILDYWGPRRLNHHTEATTMLYAARECAAILVEEGKSAVIERHRVAGAAMLAGIQALGLTTFGDLAHKMNNVVAVEIPAGLDGEAFRAAMLNDHGIEIGTAFGPLQGRVWRIGTMGYNARKDAVVATLLALEHCLRRTGILVPAGDGATAALDVYASAAGEE